MTLQVLHSGRGIGQAGQVAPMVVIYDNKLSFQSGMTRDLVNFFDQHGVGWTFKDVEASPDAAVEAFEIWAGEPAAQGGVGHTWPLIVIGNKVFSGIPSDQVLLATLSEQGYLPARTHIQAGIMGALPWVLGAGVVVGVGYIIVRAIQRRR